MSYRFDGPLIAGAYCFGGRGLGVLGAVIRATTGAGDGGAGYLFNDLTGADDGKEIRGTIVSAPSAGVLTASEDGSFVFSGAPDGAYSFTYRLFVDGVDASVSVEPLRVGTFLSLAATACVQQPLCSSGSVTLAPAPIGLAAAQCEQQNLCSGGAAGVTAAPGAMGKYCASVQLAARYGQIELIQLTNPSDPSAVDINLGRVDDAIADIDAIIDAKLAARYALPLASVPLVLRNIACDLVRARLYEDNITDRVAERERAAMKLLDQIGAGTVSLGLDAAAQPTAPTGGPSFVTRGRVFTAGSLGDYAP